MNQRISPKDIVAETRRLETEFDELDAEVEALDFEGLGIPLPSSEIRDEIDRLLEISAGERALRSGTALPGNIPIGPECSITWSVALFNSGIPTITWGISEAIPEQLLIQLEDASVSEVLMVDLKGSDKAPDGRYVVVSLLTAADLLFLGDRIEGVRSIAICPYDLFDFGAS